jgi:hypothetical protein
MKHRGYEIVILGIELIGLVAVLAIIWLDEFVDIPFRYFGAAKTPPRPEEYWFETISIVLLGAAVIGGTLWVMRRLRYLEKFLRVCAWCRRVLVSDTWVPFERYMKMKHDVASTHGICPSCRASAARAELPVNPRAESELRSQPTPDSV